MLQRLHELAAARTTFAFESTLASRTFAPWLEQLRADGWQTRILYIWVRSSDISIRRVKARVRRGGHSVPPEVIRRRYGRSSANFWQLYRPLADTWQAYDKSGRIPAHMATGSETRPPTIHDKRRFAAFLESARG